jgi:hypothetical protein
LYSLITPRHLQGVHGGLLVLLEVPEAQLEVPEAHV